MAQKEPAEGWQFPSAVGSAPKRFRGTGISAVLPAGLRTESGIARRAGNRAHLSPPAPCLRTRSARRRESRRDIHVDLSTGDPALPSPAPGFSGVCAAARPAAHSFSSPRGSRPRRGWPATAPRTPAALRSGARGGENWAGAAQLLTDRKPRSPNPSSIHLRGMAVDSPNGLK